MAKLQARAKEQSLRAESSRAAARSVCEVRREPGGKVSEGSVCSDVRQGLGWVRLGLLRAPSPERALPVAWPLTAKCPASHRTGSANTGYIFLAALLSWATGSISGVFSRMFWK